MGEFNVFNVSNLDEIEDISYYEGDGSMDVMEMRRD